MASIACRGAAPAATPTPRFFQSTNPDSFIGVGVDVVFLCCFPVRCVNNGYTALFFQFESL
jgi:hypothetical protein